jgi:hypothetical protein
VNPGTIGWWVRDWGRVQSWLHFTPRPWMSASVVSFVVAFAVALALSAVPGSGARRPAVADPSTVEPSTVDAVEGAA